MVHTPCEGKGTTDQAKSCIAPVVALVCWTLLFLLHYG